jgi:hypothetical protein
MNILKSFYRYFFFTIKKEIQVLTFKKDDFLFKQLYRNGFVHIKSVLNYDLLSRIQLEFESLKKKYSENNFYFERIPKDLEDKLFTIIDKKNLLQIISNYLGNKVLFYENLYIYTGEPESNENTWVPHHDTKGNRLKFYFWIKSDQNSHPLFYKKGSHKIFKKWSNSDETFYTNLDNSGLESIIGSPGDLTIFDTHGIHSGKKKITSPRSIVNLTFDPVSKIGLGINHESMSGKKEIERLSGRILDLRKI